MRRCRRSRRHRTALRCMSSSSAPVSLSDDEKLDLSVDAPASNRVRAYDQQSLQQLFEAAGLSDEAIEFLATTSASETLLGSAATETLREELKEVWTQGFDELVD